MYIIQRKNIPIHRNLNCAKKAIRVHKQCVSKQTEGYVLHNIFCLVYKLNCTYINGGKSH